MKEQTPLRWPEGWPRTRPQDQLTRSQWKKPQSFYVDALEEELKRMGTIASVMTWNGRGDRDPGVAIWFSRKKKEDFSWQDILEIKNPYPTVEQVMSAARSLAIKYHPDNASGDVVIFHKVMDARDAALKWVNRTEGTIYDLSIACDTFKEARLNVAALWQTIKHIRGIERCGTSSLMERTIETFAALPEKAQSHVTAAT